LGDFQTYEVILLSLLGLIEASIKGDTE